MLHLIGQESLEKFDAFMTIGVKKTKSTTSLKSLANLQLLKSGVFRILKLNTQNAFALV